MMIQMAFLFLTSVFSSSECLIQDSESYDKDHILNVSTELSKDLNRLDNTKSSTEHESNYVIKENKDLKISLEELEQRININRDHFSAVYIDKDVFKYKFRITFKPIRLRKVKNKKFVFFICFKYILTQLAFMITEDLEKFRSICGINLKAEQTIMRLFKLCVFDNYLHLYLTQDKKQFVVREVTKKLVNKEEINILNEIFFPQKFIGKGKEIVKNVAKHLRVLKVNHEFNRFDQIHARLLDDRTMKYNAKYYILYNLLREYIE